MLTPQIIHAVFVGGSSKVSHPVQWRIGMIGAKQMMQNSPANLKVSDARFALLECFPINEMQMLWMLQPDSP